MRKHASNSSPEDAGGRAVMDEGSARVGEKSLAEEFGELNLVSEEGAGDVDAFASNDYNSLT